jgi:transposase
MKYKRIAVDTSKSVFTLHGIDTEERVILRGDYSRSKFQNFFKKQAPTEVVMEACGGAHHWARTLEAMGHRVKLIPPQYVKPFVKRGKNDRNDAEAISDAASRPNMTYVPVKSAEQQADGMVLGVRELLVRQRTQLINALRGHATEFGEVVAKGISKVDALLRQVASNDAIPARARAMMALLGKEVSHLDERLAELDKQLQEQHKATPICQLLAGIPGIGPITALTLATKVSPGQFKSARHFAAWIGLTPRQNSSGGKQRLGGISRQGNERLRQLLFAGAMAVISHAVRPGSKTTTSWLLNLLNRRPRKVAAVALANKMARIAWAMMTSGEVYRSTPKAA